MAHVTRAFASLFSDSGVADSWSKLDDSHKYAWLRRKYWGRNIEDEAKQWRRLHPTVENNPANEIGSKCYGLDLAMELKCSKLWVRQDYIRIYDYCVKRHQEGPSSAEERARSVVVTGQPGIGALLSSVISSSLSNTPSREKARHTGSRMQCAVVLEKKSLFFGTLMAIASFSWWMESFSRMSSKYLRAISSLFYGRLSTQTHIQMGYTTDSLPWTRISS